MPVIFLFFHARLNGRMSTNPRFMHQTHDAYGRVLAVKQFATIVFTAGIGKPAFFHHPCRSFVACKAIGPQRLKAFYLEAIGYHGSKGLGGIAFVPIGLAHPIAYLGLVFTYIDVALSGWIIAHTPYYLSCSFEHYGPRIVIAKHCFYHPAAFFHRSMYGPSRTGPHIRVFGKSIESGGIGWSPTA